MARSQAPVLCNNESTFCFEQMPGQCHLSSTHLSIHARLPKSVFNCLENGSLHPCNKRIRAIRKINGPVNDVKQIHHDWNAITYVQACARANAIVHTDPPNTQMRLAQNTISDFFLSQKKVSSPVYHRQKLWISIIVLLSAEGGSLLMFSSRTVCLEPVAQRITLQHNM